MINVLNIIKKRLMVSIFLGTMSVSAMSMDRPLDNEAANCMKIAYSALDMAHAKRKDNVYSDICCRALESNDSDMFNHLNGLTIQDLGRIAKENLLRALELHSPHAAIVLNNNFSDDEDAPNLLISALERSIGFKKAQPVGDPHRSRLREDVYALIAAKNLLVDPLMKPEDIQRIEEIDEDIAIGIYGKHASNSNLDSVNALERLQGNPSTWIYLSKVYFERGEIEKGLEYIQRIMNQSKGFEYEALILLEEHVANTAVPLPMRLDMAELASQHVHQWNPGKPESFSTHFAYYTLLHEMEAVDSNSRGHELIKVGALLTNIAEEALHIGKPDLLFKWADILETDAKREQALQEYDFDSIIDMYIRAANAGSYDAVARLAAMPQFIDSHRKIEQVSTFFVQNNMTSGLLDLYKKHNKLAFLEILTLMSENKQKWVGFNVADAQETRDLRAQLSNSYIPKIELEIYAQSNKVSGNISFIEDAWSHVRSAEYYALASVFIPTDDYHQSGYRFPSPAAARIFLNEATAKTERMEIRIQDLRAKKEALVDTLSVQELFETASDYNLLYRAAEVMSDRRKELFLTEHLSMLCIASSKSYLPAVETLASYYTHGYSKRNYSHFRLQNEESILQNPELGVKYRIYACLTETLYPLLSSDDEVLKTNPVNNILGIIKAYIE